MGERVREREIGREEERERGREEERKRGREDPTSPQGPNRNPCSYAFQLMRSAPSRGKTFFNRNLPGSHAGFCQVVPSG